MVTIKQAEMDLCQCSQGQPTLAAGVVVDEIVFPAAVAAGVVEGVVAAANMPWPNNVICAEDLTDEQA